MNNNLLNNKKKSSRILIIIIFIYRSSGVIVTSLLVRTGALFGNFTFSFLKDYCFYFILLICLLLLGKFEISFFIG